MAILGALLASGCAALPERPAAGRLAGGGPRVRHAGRRRFGWRPPSPTAPGWSGAGWRPPWRRRTRPRRWRRSGNWRRWAPSCPSRRRQQVEALIGAEAMAPIAACSTSTSKPVAASRVYSIIPAEHDLVEGVVWDSRRRLYATTVVDRALLRVGEGGTSVAASGGLGSLFGAAYDPARKRLWVASASVDGDPEGRAGLGRPDRRSIRTVRSGWRGSRRPRARRRLRATSRSPGTAIVYASDGLNGAVYRCRPGCLGPRDPAPPGHPVQRPGPGPLERPEMALHRRPPLRDRRARALRAAGSSRSPATRP